MAKLDWEAPAVIFSSQTIGYGLYLAFIYLPRCGWSSQHLLGYETVRWK
jgi:hypothetical protein